MLQTAIILVTSILGAVLLTPCNSSAEAPAKPPAKRAVRYGSIIAVRADKIEEYRKLHASVWPEITKAVHEANLRNYSIYLRKLSDGNYYLFSYYEYVGDDYRADMAKLAANADVKRWWKLTDSCQTPLSDRKSGEWWSSMEEVFHQE